MSLLSAIPYLRLILEDNDLVAAFLPEGFRQYFGSLYQRLAHYNLLAISDKEHPIQFNLTAFLCKQPVYLDSLAWGDLILFAPGFNKCVYLLPPDWLITESYYSPISPVKLRWVTPRAAQHEIKQNYPASYSRPLPFVLSWYASTTIPP